MSDGDLPDHGRPYSDRDLLPMLEKTYRRVEGEVDTLKSLGQARAHARDALNREKAKQWLLVKQTRADMTSDKLREAWVINQTEVGSLMLACDLAETIYDDQRATIRALQSMVDILRTMSVSVREVTR